MSRRHRNVNILDSLSLQELRLNRQQHEAIVEYFWDHYCHFAHQRSLIFEELKNSLAKNCSFQKISHWQRVVSYKYSLNPLSARGSLLNEIGGRFNIGDIDQLKFPRFSALYIAEDRDIAYKERFGLYNKSQSREGLTAQELAYTSSASISIISIRGEINQVLDLTDSNTLKEFFRLISKIELTKDLLKRGRKLNICPVYQVKTIHALRKSLFDPNWRFIPMQLNIPANSQILGQIAHAAGIEAILYPSKMSNKNKCIAIFPNNFIQSSSFIEIEDDSPIVVDRRIDSNTYINFI